MLKIVFQGLLTISLFFPDLPILQKQNLYNQDFYSPLFLLFSHFAYL